MLCHRAATAFPVGNVSPEIVAFVDKYTLPSKVVSKFLTHLEKEAGGDAKTTAIHFLKTDKVWKSWVPAEVARKVEAALSQR